MKDGKAVELNEDDYFDLGSISVKSVDRSVGLDITAWDDRPNLDWVDLLWQAYGAKGLVVLGFWFLSLYAEQLRERQKSFPFLELAGEKDTGKTTLIEFLWKLCGRLNYEGFDPSKSSLSARSRNFAQVANLPVVLIEGDRDEDSAKSKRFDFDELKSLYNGRSGRSRGVKNGGNETYEPPFRGAVIIEQNQPVLASDATLSRFVGLRFDGEGYNASTKKAADKLEVLALEEVSGFILAAAKAEAKVLASIAETFPAYERSLMESPKVANRRIAKCHGQLLAGLEALDLVVPIAPERLNAAQALVMQMAAERKLSIAADHPVVEQFWETFDYLCDLEIDMQDRPKLNHARDKGLIAVSLNEFINVAAKHRQQVPDLTELKRHLRSSKVRKFIDVKDVNSAVESKTLHCWVFARPNN